jgi:hypothetical protein
MTYQTLYDARADVSLGWWVVGLGAVIALSALLSMTAPKDKSLDADQAPRSSWRFLIFLFLAGIAIGAGPGLLLLQRDHAMRLAATTGKCRAIEGYIRAVRTHADSQVLSRWGQDILPGHETFAIAGEEIMIRPNRFSLGYKRTANSGSIIREGRWLRLCALSNGPAPEDQIIVRIDARRADVVFDAERGFYVYRD